MKEFHYKVVIKLSTLCNFISYLMSVLLVGIFASDLVKDLAFHSTKMAVFDGLALVVALLSCASDIRALIKED